MLIILLAPFFLLKNEKFSNIPFSIPANLNSYDEQDFSYTTIEKIYMILWGYKADYYYRWELIDKIFVAILYIATFLISASAAYLSYKCTWGGTIQNIALRVLFAFLAFMLGPIYLIWYFFVNYLGNLCYTDRKEK